ncbi:HAD-IIB family hydrolase [Vibrio rumoiensis]|uniref:Mannosyl-3-phosphoglycerate phosphatase n=1 Tax=Vibrio rumoiensis 1S-45 TaxID=1188252 RepID=A0A1E5DZE1_9VIBR|nr:HAD-IIB family hydrolase [Vibrio rumoiensis]OEF23212.1 hypothetical protein A1QC_12630 [Vibrio rumoiensis 1S-45]
MLNRNQLPIIFTDLDGTLLDHDDYSAKPVEGLLKELKQAQIDVIPNTSKTFAELIELRTKLGLTCSFVIENGAAVYFPMSSFPEQPRDCVAKGEYWVKYFSLPRPHWQALLEKASLDFNGLFRAFYQMTTSELCKLTGLTYDNAMKANQRECGEPVYWLGDDVQKVAFIQHLEKQGAQVLQGGRFLHISDHNDKGQAMLWLLEQYQIDMPNQSMVSIALGDSQNDVAMLERAGIAVRIASKHHDKPILERTEGVIDSQAFGPRGWDQEIRALLSNHLLHSS